jgi:hypothetical protein
MVSMKQTRSKRTVASKRSAEELATAIGKKHRHLAKAVHSALEGAGFKGVRVHSLQLSVARGAMAGPGCDPPCPPGQRCVLHSDGEDTSWVCVPE